MPSMLAAPFSPNSFQSQAFTEDQNIHSDFTPKHVEQVNLSDKNITSVVWATGFKTQFDWVKLPIFSERGHPVHQRGATSTEGIYFLGLNWMHTWGSGRFFHVGKDAEYLSDNIKEYLEQRMKEEVFA